MATSNSRQKFDPARYSGKWYEVMRLPLVWQNDCGGATADYQLIPSTSVGTNSISVKNSCLDDNGNVIRVRNGQADYLSEDPLRIFPVKFKLNFDDQPTADSVQIPDFVKQMAPGVDQPYWIEYTDYDCYAVVGGPSRQFVWLLSREPKVDFADVDCFSQWLQKLGYNTDELIVWDNRLL